MLKKDSSLAVMFADISGSTTLFESVGDTRAFALTQECIEILKKVINTYQGTLVKTIGDEVMCTFPTASDAANAAIEMQEKVSDAQHIGLKIRIGFHFGPVIEEHNDVFGDSVNSAARIAAQAKAGQILTTKESVDEMTPVLKYGTRLLDRTRVKGKRKDLEIYEVAWGDEEEQTVFVDINNALKVSAAESNQNIKLNFQGKEVEVNENASSVTMGRGAQNTILIADVMVSRLHAVVEYRKGKFFLIDKSANGTYVLTDEGQKLFLRRDEMPLEGKGVIGLGREVASGDPAAIEYYSGEA